MFVSLTYNVYVMEKQTGGLGKLADVVYWLTNYIVKNLGIGESKILKMTMSRQATRATFYAKGILSCTVLRRSHVDDTKDET